MLALAVARILGRPRRPRLVVLYYHGVPAPAQEGFARQLDALVQGATVVRAAYTGATTDRKRSVAITFDDALHSVAEHGVPQLERRSLPATIFVPAGFVGQEPGWEIEAAYVDRSDRVMTADELRALPQLVEVGSHTLRHPHLRALDDARLQDELAGSRRELEQLTGRPVTLFAFPYGEHDERVDAACRDAGYERAFGIEPRPVDPLGDEFVRGRVSVDPTDGRLVFYLKSRGAYAWMVHASTLKRAVRGGGRRR